MNATIEFDSTVLLGADSIDWNMPHPAGPAPADGDVFKISRFLTENQPLRIVGLDTTQWEIQVDGGLVAASPRAGGDGWDIEVTHAPAVALPDRARVRVWAVIPKDADIFDLGYDRETAPNLDGTRSYLDDPIWLPVRDFHIEVEEPPALPDDDEFADTDYEFELPVQLGGPERVIVTRPANAPQVEKRRTGNALDRGDRWRLSVTGDVVEEDTVYPVQIRYGRPGHFHDDNFQLTFKARFTLEKDPAVAAYEVSDGSPLELTIQGGTAPFSVEESPPGTTVAIDGRTVTIEVTDAPAAAARHEVVIEDDADHRGKRTIRVLP